MRIILKIPWPTVISNQEMKTSQYNTNKKTKVLDDLNSRVKNVFQLNPDARLDEQNKRRKGQPNGR